MQLRNRSSLVFGFLLAGGAFVLLLTRPTHALLQGQGNGPPSREVLVINGGAEAVPVTGSIAVEGMTSIEGTVQATQSGPWTVGIDPAHNVVALKASSTFLFDSNFSVINEGATIELGPFDLSSVHTLRVLARAVNGDVRFQLVVPGPFGGLQLDDFALAGESGNRYESRSYEAAPTSVLVRVIEEGGPGGANYHVALVGR